MTGFAATARDEPHLDKLSRALVGLTAETNRPAQVRLWLRGNEETAR